MHKTSKENVNEKYPYADSWKKGKDHWVIYSILPNGSQLGSGLTARQAWEDAEYNIKNFKIESDEQN